MISTDSEHGLHEDLVLAQARARRASALALLAIALIVGFALAVLSVISLKSVSQSERNGDALAAVQKRLDAKDQVAADIADCNALLQAVARNANRDYLASLGELVIIIATVVPEDRPAKIGDAVTNVDSSLASYRSASTELSDWQTLPVAAQLPCPVTG